MSKVFLYCLCIIYNVWTRKTIRNNPVFFSFFLQIIALKDFYFTLSLIKYIFNAFYSILLHLKHAFYSISLVCKGFNWECSQTAWKEKNVCDVCCLNAPLFQMPIIIQPKRAKTWMFSFNHCYVIDMRHRGKKRQTAIDIWPLFISCVFAH